MTSVDINQKYITQSQAAKILGITKQAVSELVKRGRIKSVNVLGRKAIALHEVQGFTRLKPGRKKIK